MNNKLLITFGCSWTYGVGVSYTPGMTEEQYNQNAWNNDIADRDSFRGIISKKYNYKNKNFSEGGSSNQQQFRLAKQYFSSREFLNDKKTYNKIIVLWGITSIYRNELYSNKENKLVNYIYNNTENSLFQKKFIDEYFKNVFNNEDALRELSLDILFWDSFFSSQGVENYWFDTFNHHDYIIPFENITSAKQNYQSAAGKDWPSWEHYKKNKLDEHIPSNVYEEIHNSKLFHWAKYKKNFLGFNNIIDYDKNPRDIASYLAKANGLELSKNTNSQYHYSNWKVDTTQIEYLKNIGLVNPISLHPTKEAHQKIAEYFSSKIKF